MNPTELMMQKRQTAAFIASDAMEIVLTRHTRTKTPSGGYTDSTDPLPPQQFKFIRAGLPQISQNPTVGGVETQTQDQLLGMPDADIQKGDALTIDDDEYIVNEVSDLPYRKVAILILREDRGSR